MKPAHPVVISNLREITGHVGPVGPKLRFWPSRRTFWERGIRY